MSDKAKVWRCGEHTFELGSRTLLMGIVNVTPDSFSDGGAFADTDAAVKHALQLLEDGADIIDIGGESTRPGAEPVPEDLELQRVLPVIERFHREAPHAVISVDTRKTAIAKAAVEAGASIVNDVTGGSDEGMLEMVAGSGAGMVLMHMRSDPKTMQENPTYEDVVAVIRNYLADRVGAAVGAGIPRNHLAVDPGIGFGKNLQHNLELLRAIESFHAFGLAVLVGVSRKRFIGELSGALDPADRLEGTAAAVAWCASQRIDVLRVHDVKEMRRVVSVIDAIVRGAVS